MSSRDLPEVHPAFGISCYVSGCDAAGTGSSLSGNMLIFQASVSGNGQRFSVLQMRLWHSPCQRTPFGCSPVPHVSACWLTGLGLGTPSRYLARTPESHYCYYDMTRAFKQVTCDRKQHVPS